MARPRDINGEPIIDPEEEAEKKKKAAERPKRKPKKAPTTKGRARKLTPRQEKFVSLIVKGKSQHDAYVAAYKTEGWTNERINQEASKVLHRQNVFSRYQELMKRRLIKRIWRPRISGPSSLIPISGSPGRISLTSSTSQS